MSTYIAPDIEPMKPSPEQQEIIDQIVQAVQEKGAAIWSQGRGAGKSTLRAMIAQAILDDDNHESLYEVMPREEFE